MSRTARRSPWPATPAVGPRPARHRTRPAIAAVGPAILLGLLLSTVPAFRPSGGLPATAAPAGQESAARTGSIATYAGGLRDANGGPTTFNMLATSVAPVRPGVVAVADAAHSVVWLVNRSGRPITTYGRTIGAGRAGIVVGNGGGGFGGDGGPATRAMINVPISLAVDSAGNLYIADLGNNRVRKVGRSTASSPRSSATANGPQAEPAGRRPACRWIQPGSPWIAPATSTCLMTSTTWSMKFV
jgi:NHL repeat-containing protein